MLLNGGDVPFTTTTLCIMEDSYMPATQVSINLAYKIGEIVQLGCECVASDKTTHHTFTDKNVGRGFHVLMWVCVRCEAKIEVTRYHIGGGVHDDPAV